MSTSRILHPTAIAAGFAAVLIGYSSSAVIIFQAARAAGASPDQVGSWMIALGIGMGLTTIGLSWRHRMPIITAWSTPGAALLATSLQGVGLDEAIGAFIFSAALITVSGFSGGFERIMNRVPLSLAGAMLAGILFKFGIDAFVSMESRFLLVLVMFAVYLAAKRLIPRYTILLVLAVGFLYCLLQGWLDFSGFELAIGPPQFVMPAFSPSAMIGVGIPLFVVTMVSQNIPGIAVLRTDGYPAPVSSAIGWTGLATLLLAPFGGFALNLAAITAAICTGPEAHPEAAKRYHAGLAAGVFYILLGIGGGAIAALFAAFPSEFILALAGLALLSTIANSLYTAVADSAAREAAVITFVVTASGLSLFGIGAAFWGLVAGGIATLVYSPRKLQP
ncbi:MAG TPA: benzoate/H(+) symporter BenE family transporter [Gammaproteobacteria bacterium]|nr:benzoate/H(+) symporter BenE family transporter [Gammaproteobacteria bacterium]